VRRTLVLAATVAVVLTACTGGGSNISDRRADTYSAVIRTILADTSHPKISSDTSVFVVAADERSPIALEVQADIVAELHEVATIRFVDRRVEAIDDSNPNRPVNDNGLLITLGKIASGPKTVTSTPPTPSHTGSHSNEPRPNGHRSQLRIRRPAKRRMAGSSNSGSCPTADARGLQRRQRAQGAPCDHCESRGVTRTP
jgi:hypothetical protein